MYNKVKEVSNYIILLQNSIKVSYIYLKNR